MLLGELLTSRHSAFPHQFTEKSQQDYLIVCVLLHVNFSIGERGSFHSFPLYFITVRVLNVLPRNSARSRSVGLCSVLRRSPYLLLVHVLGCFKRKVQGYQQMKLTAVGPKCCLYLDTQGCRRNLILILFICDHQASAFSVEPGIFTSCCFCITCFVRKTQETELFSLLLFMSNFADSVTLLTGWWICLLRAWGQKVSNGILSRSGEQHLI